MIKIGKVKPLYLNKLFPKFRQEKQKALVKLGNALVEELFILSSGEEVESITGSLRRSIFMNVTDVNIEVGYDIQKASHAYKFGYVIELAWNNVHDSSIFKDIIRDFKIKAFS